MKIRTPPTPVTSSFLGVERNQFDFHKGKVIGSNGKWKSSKSASRTISTVSSKQPEFSKKRHKAAALTKKKALCSEFSIKVQSVASPDKPKDLAKCLDSLSTLSGEGSFELLNGENPIHTLLFDPSKALEDDLGKAENELSQFKTPGKKWSNDDFKLINLNTFKNKVQSEMQYKVLDETVQCVNSAKSLKFIMDEINKPSMNNYLNKQQRTKLKKTVGEKLKKLYEPTLHSLVSKHCNLVESVSGGKKEQKETLISEIHDFIVTVKDIKPKLLDMKTLSNRSKDKSELREMVEVGMKNIITEMCDASKDNAVKSQKTLQHVNGLLRWFVDPVVNLTSSNIEKHSKSIRASIEPEYSTLKEKSVSVVKLHLKCQNTLTRLKDIGNNKNTVNKKRSEAKSMQEQADMKNGNKNHSKKLLKQREALQKEADKIEHAWHESADIFKNVMSDPDTDNISVYTQFAHDLSNAFKDLDRMEPKAILSEVVNNFSSRLLEISQSEKMSVHFEFDTEKAVLLSEVKGENTPQAQASSNTQKRRAPSTPSSTQTASSSGGASVVSRDLPPPSVKMSKVNVMETPLVPKKKKQTPLSRRVSSSERSSKQSIARLPPPPPPPRSFRSSTNGLDAVPPPPPPPPSNVSKNNNSPRNLSLEKNIIAQKGKLKKVLIKDRKISENSLQSALKGALAGRNEQMHDTPASSIMNILDKKEWNDDKKEDNTEILKEIECIIKENYSHIKEETIKTIAVKIDALSGKRKTEITKEINKLLKNM